MGLVAAALQSLCDLDNAGGSQTGRAQHNELLRVGKAGNAAGSLDLHMGRDMGGEQLHVVERRAGLGKARGSLDVVRAGVGDALAQGDLFLVGEQAGLDDDFQQLSVAGGLHGGDLLRDLLPQAVLRPADVDDHVHLVRAVRHGVGGHEALGGGGVVAVGEADDGADGQPVPNVLLRLLHVGRGDADGGGVILHTVVADAFDLRPGGGLGQQGVVALGKNVFQFHDDSPSVYDSVVSVEPDDPVLPDAPDVALVTHGNIAVVAAQHHLRALGDDVAVAVDTGVHRSLRAAVADGLDLLNGVRHLHQAAAAGKQAGLEVRA